jgi:YD repeat-containing protein
MKHVFFGILFLSFSAALPGCMGCDQREPHRVAEISFEYASGNTQIHEYHYDDSNQLKEVEISEDGETIAGYQYEYEDNQLAEVEYEVPGQADVVSEYKWENGQLVEKEESQAGSYDAEVEYDYADNGLLTGIRKVTSSDSETVLTTDLDFDYDDDDKLEEWKEVLGLTLFGVVTTETTKNEVDYDSNGRLEEIQTTVSSDFGGITDEDVFEWEYDFSDDGRLVEAEGGVSQDYEVEYDDQNRIVEIRAAQDDVVISYTYEDGASPSIVVDPAGFAHSFLFDLSGKAYSQVDMRSQYMLLR